MKQQEEDLVKFKGSRAKDGGPGNILEQFMEDLIQEGEQEEILIEKELGSKYLYSKADYKDDIAGSTLKGINQKMSD